VIIPPLAIDREDFGHLLDVVFELVGKVEAYHSNP
jgi:hypothetical protein